MEIIHTAAVWRDYTHTVEANGEAPVDAQGDFSFGAFAAFVARQIEEDGYEAQRPREKIWQASGQAEMIVLYDQERENR